MQEGRYSKLMKAQARVSFRKNRALIGRIEPVLVEGVSEETELLLRGRSIRQAPDVDGLVYITAGQADIGDIVQSADHRFLRIRPDRRNCDRLTPDIRQGSFCGYTFAVLAFGRPEV